VWRLVAYVRWQSAVVGYVVTCLRVSSVKITVRFSKQEVLQSGEIGKRGRGRLEVALVRVGEGECCKAVKE
jgi:hypothetical protein